MTFAADAGVHKIASSAVAFSSVLVEAIVPCWICEASVFVKACELSVLEKDYKSSNEK